MMQNTKSFLYKLRPPSPLRETRSLLPWILVPRKVFFSAKNPFIVFKMKRDIYLKENKFVKSEKSHQEGSRMKIEILFPSLWWSSSYIPTDVVEGAAVVFRNIMAGRSILCNWSLSCYVPPCYFPPLGIVLFSWWLQKICDSLPKRRAQLLKKVR